MLHHRAHSIPLRFTQISRTRPSAEFAGCILSLKAWVFGPPIGFGILFYGVRMGLWCWVGFGMLGWVWWVDWVHPNWARSFGGNPSSNDCKTGVSTGGSSLVPVYLTSTQILDIGIQLVLEPLNDIAFTSSAPSMLNTNTVIQYKLLFGMTTNFIPPNFTHGTWRN